MQPTNYDTFFDALSGPRINAYKHYFSTLSDSPLKDEEVFGCYQWNEAVANSFFKLITLIEIVLRNKMHEALSAHYYSHAKATTNPCRGRNQQSISIATLGTNDSSNWYNSIDQTTNQPLLNNKSLSKIFDKTHTRRGNYIQQPHSPSPDDVISSLSFGFWSSLIDKCSNIDWVSLLPQIFPHHRTTHSNQWGSAIEQKKLSYRLELIRDFRNRIAHHEPVWKFGALLSETPPTAPATIRQSIDSATSTPEQSIKRLRNLYSKHLEFLKWLSNDLFQDFRKSSLHTCIDWLISEEGLNDHLNRDKKLISSMGTSKFKRELPKFIRGKHKALLYRQGRNVLSLHHIS